jgi:hypothetical protein
MPVSSFDLTTEFNYYANALIIDEVGEQTTVLIDKLVSQDCLVNYFGKESPETFAYLAEKNHFCYLTAFSEIESLKKIDYLFYFPAPIKNRDVAENVFGGALIREGDLFRLAQDHACKILLGCPLGSLAVENYRLLVKEKRLNARLAVFDCLFGPKVKSGPLGELFRAVVGEQRLEMACWRDEPIFPLSAEALAESLINLIFSPLTKGKSYLLYSGQTTLADFAEVVKKYAPGMTVDFSGGGWEGKPRKGEGLEELVVAENWEEAIEKTVDWFQKNVPPYPQLAKSDLSSGPPKPADEEKLSFLVRPLPVLPQPEEKSEEKKEKKVKTESRVASLPKKVIFGSGLFAFLLFIFFILPFLLAGIFGLLGIKELEGTRRAVEKGNFSLAIKKNLLSQRYLSFSQRLLLTTSPFYALVGFDKPVGKINGVFQFTQQVDEALGFALVASREFFGWANEFLGGAGGNQPEVLASIKANLASAYERASLAQSSLASVEPGFKYLRQSEQYEKLKNYLPESREVLIKGQTLISVLPKLLGFFGRKTYLVLFQNNAELRPTGGFIGSYATVSVENGKLVDFEVFDVYQADGQLKGHIEPPAKLKEYLGEANWFLRDSNWDPDFAISAQRAEWFLDKEMQLSTDGVIGVTLEAARKIVAALGEIEVLDYQEKVNEGNLFQKAEYFSELGTFPGSTQKKDFLGGLFQSLFERVKSSQGKDLMEVGGALFAALEQKEIIFYFDDAEVQRAVAGLNWGGNIREYQPRMSLVAAFPDYLFINEANVGVNKANFFLQRKIDHQINLNRDGRVEEKLTIAYENQSPSNDWPAGAYKTYLRLYLPQETKVTSILITDSQNSSLWVPFDWRYFDISEEHGKALFGFFFEVPIKTKRVIEIKYELAQTMDFSKRLNAYLLLVQKQPGAHPSDYTLNFVYPENFVPVRVIPSAIVGQQQLLTSNKLTKDLIFQLDLAH